MSRPAAPPAWPTLAAAWGYLGRGESVHDWNADAVLAHPESS